MDRYSAGSDRSLLLVADVGAAHGHVGDQAMLVSNLAWLRRWDPAARITVLGRGDMPVERADDVPMLGWPDLTAGPSASLPPTIAAAVASSGGLFISGGGNLCSTWPDLLWQRVMLLREARRVGIPAVTGGQTLGPTLSAAEQTALAEELPGVEHFGARELPSAALALRLGVRPDRLWYQVDDAYFLEAQAPRSAVAGDLPDGPFLAVTLDQSFSQLDWAGVRSLARQLARAATGCGLSVVFLPHVGTPGSTRDGDGEVGEQLCERLRGESVPCVLMPVATPSATAWFTGRAAAVVSSRYHPLVFGTAAAVPCLGVYRDSYTRIKIQGALAHVGAQRWCVSASAAAEGALAGAMARLWVEREQITTELRAARQRHAAHEDQRRAALLGRLGWSEVPSPPRRSGRLGVPDEEVVPTALSVLALERQAGDEEACRLRGLVRHLERAVDLGWSSEDRSARRTVKGRTTMLSEQQWSDYDREGFLRLGQVLEPDQVRALQRRADDLAQGTRTNPNVQMQLDTGGAYDELPQVVTSLERGTLLYRKIQGLETDDLFSPLVRHPLFLEVCARVYGPHAPVSIFRAMVMNKPAGQGTILPWHQDGGDVWALDRDPLITIWVALDPATRANGCVEVVPGTHRLGLLTSHGSTVHEEDVVRYCPPDRVLPLEVEAGHAVLIHNWLIHRSGVNPSPVPRRAFTACYMDGRTLNALTGGHFPIIAGSVSVQPYPFVRQLRDECETLRRMREESERYAKSLEQERERSRSAATEASVPRRWATRWFGRGPSPR